LKLLSGIRRTWIAVINKHYSVPYEDVGFYSYPFANKGVATNFAIVSDFCAFLDFNECSNPSRITDFAAVKVNKSVNLHIPAEADIRFNPAIIWKLVIDTMELQSLPRIKQFSHSRR
jgi:hypothetical protein